MTLFNIEYTILNFKEGGIIMKNILIQSKNLKKQFNARTVINDVSFNIYEKEILAIIGPNGAGKTTLIEMILGLKKPDMGEISLWEQNYRKHIGVQLQATPFFPGLTAFENLELFAAFYKRKLTKQEITGLLTVCGLGEVMKTEAAKLSGGQQKRLAIAIAIVHNPKVIFLDEPTAALDPNARNEIHQLIKKLSNIGTTIIFTSHDMTEVEKLAHRVMMITGGNIIAQGKPDEICSQHGVRNSEELYIKLTNGGK